MAPFDPTDRWTLGRMQNPVRGFLHGAAAVASVLGTGLLIVRADTALARFAVVVFGLGLLGLYTTSSLYHSVPWARRWKSRMQRLDHAMIFVLIAASYTPIGLLVLEGAWQWIALAGAWGLAVLGVTHRLLTSMERHELPFALMVVMGWLSAPLMMPVSRSLGWNAVGLIGLGGLLYTVGMVFKVTHWPRLWPRVFSAHELFHVLVVTASVFHWVATYRFVLPASAA